MRLRSLPRQQILSILFDDNPRCSHSTSCDRGEMGEERKGRKECAERVWVRGSPFDQQ